MTPADRVARIVRELIRRGRPLPADVVAEVLELATDLEPDPGPARAHLTALGRREA